MYPNNNTMPSELENALTDQFGSIEDFKNKFADAGATQFGSGWCWLSKRYGWNVKDY